MGLYVDGKRIGTLVPGSLKIRVVGGSRDGEELIEGKDFSVDCKNATVTFLVTTGNEVRVEYGAQPYKKTRGRKAQWKQPRYGRRP